MTTLALHYHPLSSYCQKVLIALDELSIEAEKRLLNLPSGHKARNAERSAGSPRFKYYPGRSGLSRRFFDPQSS
jgi:glutathione S-transferase